MSLSPLPPDSSFPGPAVRLGFQSAFLEGFGSTPSELYYL